MSMLVIRLDLQVLFSVSSTPEIMRALAHGLAVAEADGSQVIQIEGNAYFPVAALTGGRLGAQRAGP